MVEKFTSYHENKNFIVEGNSKIANSVPEDDKEFVVVMPYKNNLLVGESFSVVGENFSNKPREVQIGIGVAKIYLVNNDTQEHYCLRGSTTQIQKLFDEQGPNAIHYTLDVRGWKNKNLSNKDEIPGEEISSATLLLRSNKEDSEIRSKGNPSEKAT